VFPFAGTAIPSFSHRGTCLITPAGARVKVRVMKGPRKDTVYSFSTGAFRQMTFSRDGMTVATGSWEGKLTVHIAGKQAWQKDLTGGVVAEVSPDGKTVVAGTWQGWVHKFTIDGKAVWKKRIPMLIPPSFNLNIPRKTGVGARENPLTELRKAVDLAEVSLANRGFEDGTKGWKVEGEASVVQAKAVEGKKCLKLSGTISQEITASEKDIPEHSTLAILFRYKSDDMSAMIQVTADANRETKKAFALKGNDWHWARLVFKVGRPGKRVKISLASLKKDAPVYIDDVHLFRLDYPSDNYLFVYEAYVAVDEAAEDSTDLKIDVWADNNELKPSFNALYLVNGGVADVRRKWFMFANANRPMEALPARVRFLFPFAVPVSHVAVFCDPNHPQRLSPNVVVDYLRMDTGEEVVYDVAGTKRNIDDTFFIIRFKKPITTTE